MKKRTRKLLAMAAKVILIIMVCTFGLYASSYVICEMMSSTTFIEVYKGGHFLLHMRLVRDFLYILLFSVAGVTIYGIARGCKLLYLIARKLLEGFEA